MFRNRNRRKVREAEAGQHVRISTTIANKVTVRVWFDDSGQHSGGQISLQTHDGGANGDGIYVSLHSARTGGQFNYSFRDLREDLGETAEGTITIPPDMEIAFYTLDVAEINRMFTDFQQSGRDWALFDFDAVSIEGVGRVVYDSASLVLALLKAGGAKELFNRLDALPYWHALYYGPGHDRSLVKFVMEYMELSSYIVSEITNRVMGAVELGRTGTEVGGDMGETYGKGGGTIIGGGVGLALGVIVGGPVLVPIAVIGSVSGAVYGWVRGARTGRAVGARLGAMTGSRSGGRIAEDRAEENGIMVTPYCMARLVQAAKIVELKRSGDEEAAQRLEENIIETPSASYTR
jgi:hypothetical protein